MSAHSIARAFDAPADSLRKGWCPGALRPMAAKDGLIVRLRLTGGIVPVSVAHAIADLAERHGNGRLDLSGRGNLQMRGVQEGAWPALVEALGALGLVDDNPDAESVRNVLASPLAGRHGGFDIRPLVRALEAALVVQTRLHRLPAKVLFLVDDGDEPSLGTVAADIRFDWRPALQAFSIGLGGTRAGALRIGTCRADALVDEACRIAEGAIALFERDPAVRRVRGLIDVCGPEIVAASCGGTVEPPLEALPRPRLAGPQRFGDTHVLSLALPFGRLDAAMLRQAAALAIGELRLTPWRAILLPDVVPAAGDRDALAAAGFILDLDDARLRVAACVGWDGCARATTPTQTDATALADLAPAGGLHVSGCEKGCAQAASAPVTLVGRDGRYDLVRDGRARDVPVARVLDLAAVRRLLAEVR